MVAVFQDVLNAAVFQIANNFAPAWRDGKGGPKALHIPLVFTREVTEVDIELFGRVAEDDLEYIQTMYVDNSLNSASLILKFNGLYQTVTVPPFSQGTFPVLVPRTNPKFSAKSTGGITIDIYLLNVPLPYAVWGASASGGQSGVNRGTFTDDSGTITVGGTSQQVMAANASRKGLMIQNPSTATESLFVNFGAAATTTGNSVELLPGGTFWEDAGMVSTETVNVVAATGGHAFMAKEFN